MRVVLAGVGEGGVDERAVFRGEGGFLGAF
jgi:hypothetical protein